MISEARLKFHTATQKAYLGFSTLIAPVKAKHILRSLLWM